MDNTRLDEVLAVMQEPAAADLLSPFWEDSVATLGDAVPLFLQVPRIIENRSWSGFAIEVEPQLLAAAQCIRESPTLTMLAWHCYRLLFVHSSYARMKEWPSLESALGAQRGVFYLLVAMAMVPQVRSLHAQLGVPEHVTRDTCSQIACMARNYAGDTDGLLGYPLRSLYWLRHYTSGRLFRVGRFEYKLEPFNGGVEVYYNRQTDQTIALAPDGVRFSADGFMTRDDDTDSWVSTLNDNESAVSGYVISPFGTALQKKVELPKDTWECVLRKGVTTLDLHIPEGGGMSPQKCRESLQSAVPFFRSLFPDRPFQAITSFSWIFNTELEEIQLSSINLVHFQHELYLFPTRSSGIDGLWFIFNRDPFDLATAPRKTSLQRGVADFLATGKRWRSGGMFVLTRHLERYGTAFYRTQFDETLAK